MVASGIAATLHIKLVIVALLGVVAGHIAFALLTHHVADKSPLALEVIADGVSLVRGFAILEDRASLRRTNGIDHPTGKDRTVIHIHRDNLRLQVSPRIAHFALSEKMGKAGLSKYNGVVRLVSDRCIQCLLLLGGYSHRVLPQRVLQQCGIPPLQGVRALHIRCHIPPPATLGSSFTGEQQQDKQQCI